jgi:hypothetical protein
MKLSKSKRYLKKMNDTLLASDYTAIYQVALGQPSRKLEELYNSSFKQITHFGFISLKKKA